MAAMLLVSFSISILAPKTSYADTGKYNILQLLGENCHDLNSITHDFSQYSGRGDHYVSACHEKDNPGGWQEELNRSLNCSTDMFYTHDFQADPNDNSVTKTLWYTDQGDYKACYDKAKAMYETMSDPNGPCHLMKKDSDNYKDCTKDQENLYNAIGCDSSMFQKIEKDGNEYYTIKPKASADCKQRVDDVGKVRIIVIGPDGKTMEGDPTSSASVKSSEGTLDSAGGSDANQLGCDGSSNPLTWIICPVINDLLVPAIEATDNLITSQMTVDTQSIFCGPGSSNDDSCKAYYTAWASFRNISLGLLAIVGLIVVIAQALGMEIVDAYTIRKMLPRILIAAIGITLSWTLMSFAVTLSNDLGFGIRNLIVAPFHSLSSNINIDFADSPILNTIIGGGVAAAAIPIWTVSGGLGVLISYIATAGLAVLIAVIVLILREVAIIMMVLLAPIALIAYVMPNTQRVFRLWWESFVRALLMFPMIAAFIATGRVFAAISLNGTNSGGDIGTAFHGIIGFIAYFAPYFMIPLTFRLSGGVMNGIGSAIAQRGQGVQGLLSGYRGNQRKERVARARAEGLYRPGFGKFKIPGTNKHTSVGKALNTTNFWALNADEMIPYKLGTTNLGKAIDGKKGIPLFRRGGQVLESQIQRARRDQTVQGAQDLDIGYKSGRLMAGQFQYYYGALDSAHRGELDNRFGIKDSKTGKITGWRAPENWAERMKTAEIFKSAAGPEGLEAREAAVELEATAAEFDKYTKSPETNRVDGRLLGMVSAAKAGRLEVGDVVNNHNRLLAAGNQEEAMRETTILQDALTPKRVSAARGHAISYDEDGTAHNVYDNPASPKAQASLMRINTQEIAAGKSEDVDALRETLVAGASQVKMELDHDTGRVKPAINDAGGVDLKDPNSVEGRRVKEIRNRIKTLAMYNSGDSDVGVKVRDIWVNRLGLPEDELEWGSRGHSTSPEDVAAAGFGPAGAPPDDGGGGAPHP